MKSRWAERIFSLILMALAVSAYWQTLNLPQTETRTGLFTGPAFFPQWLSILLIACCAVTFGRTYFQTRPESDSQAFPPARVLLKIFAFLGVIGLALIITPITGWLGAQFLLVLAIEIGFERRKWALAALISAAAVAVIYGIFELGLGVRLPRGFWD